MLRSRKNASTRWRMFLPPNDESVRFGDPCGLVQPQDTDDAALVNRAMDPLQQPDHGVRLPDLRELVARDLHRLQDLVGLVWREQAMLGDELVFEDVKPQEGASRSLFPLSHAAVRAGPRGLSRPPARRAKAFSNPGPPGFSPDPFESVKSQMLFLGTACTTRPT